MADGVRYRPRPTSALRDWQGTERPDYSLAEQGPYRADPPAAPQPDAFKIESPFEVPSGRPWADHPGLVPGPTPTTWGTNIGVPMQTVDWARVAGQGGLQPSGEAWTGTASGSDLYGSAINSAWEALRSAMSGGGPDAAAVAQAEAQRALDLQEEALRQAMLDGDMERAQEALAGLEEARAYMKQAYSDYSQLVTPHYNESIRNAGRIFDDNQPALNRIAMEEQGALSGHFEEGRFDVTGQGEVIGADAQANEAAADIVGELHGLFVMDAKGRQVEATNVLAALERAAVTENQALKAEDEYDMRNMFRIEDAQGANAIEGQQDKIQDLQYRQQLFNLDKEQAAMAHQESLRRLNEIGEDPYMDAIGFGQLTAETFLYDALGRAGVPLDRQMVLRDIMESAWSKGIFEPDQFTDWMQAEDADGQARWQGVVEGGLSQNEIQLLWQAMGAYQKGRDQYAAASTDSGGTTYGINRGGEAPNNKAHAAEARRGEGVYGARAQRVSSLIPQIESQFDVRFGGQWRDINADVTADRSANSDHYSGGALDFFGSDAEMKRLADWLGNRSDVSFVKIHGSPPHVHVSFKL